MFFNQVDGSREVLVDDHSADASDIHHLLVRHLVDESHAENVFILWGEVMIDEFMQLMPSFFFLGGD